MVPLVVLIVAFIAFRFSGLSIAHFANWQNALRAALGVMFLLTASAHWGKRRPDLVRMVPSRFGHAARWVTLTGIAEVLIAMGLQFRQTVVVTAAVTVVMLIGMFPANVKAAREHLTIGGSPVPSLVPRVVIQLVFLAAVVAAAWPR